MAEFPCLSTKHHLSLKTQCLLRKKGDWKHTASGTRIPALPCTQWPRTRASFSESLSSVRCLHSHSTAVGPTAPLGTGDISLPWAVPCYGVDGLESHPFSPGLLETTVQKVARVKAPNKSLPSAVYCIEDKM